MNNGIPARYLFTELQDSGDILKAIEQPQTFAAGRLKEILAELIAARTHGNAQGRETPHLRDALRGEQPDSSAAKPRALWQQRRALRNLLARDSDVAAMLDGNLRTDHVALQRDIFMRNHTIKPAPIPGSFLPKAP